MNQEEFGKFIKKLRKEHHLTQKQLADELNVTFQAVSKWENGKNMPDLSILKEISKKYNLTMEEMLGTKPGQKKKHNKLILLGIILIGIILIFILLKKHNADFYFNTLSSSCNNFNISGSIAYNDKKSAIYITNIEYCGTNKKKEYKKIDCTLYVTHEDIEQKISSYNYDKETPITLEAFLKNITFTIKDYQNTCQNHSKDTLYLLINGYDENNEITSYKIPLTMNDCQN